MDAFDSDVLIYAAMPDNALGARIRELFAKTAHGRVGVGSVLLLPEVLSKPARTGDADEVEALRQFLGRLDLRPTSRASATLAAALGARYALRAADSVHLATAIEAGATRFVTNNRRDFDRRIEEIEIVFPDSPDLLPPAPE